MRVLHSSDWHIGRTFHGHATLDALAEALGELPRIVRERQVDAVLVAGDVFDSAAPSAQAYRLLGDVLREVRGAGAAVVLSSGNHDSPARLGFQAEWAQAAGVHVRTDPSRLDRPVELADPRDEAGPLLVYALPYLEPVLVRHRLPAPPGADEREQAVPAGHTAVLGQAMELVRADLERRRAAGPAPRSIVMAHCFAAGAAAAEGELERDITRGGLDIVPPELFAGVDYVALGHLHRRARLRDRAGLRVRYSGAPLHLSFAEADSPRGCWLIDFDAHGVRETEGRAAIEWVPLPVPRPLVTLRGELARLLTDPANEPWEQAWVRAVLTDRIRPVDPMRRLQERFPRCALIEFDPPGSPERDGGDYGQRVRSAVSDEELLAGFLAHVRDGAGPSPAERELLAEIVAAERAGPDGDEGGTGPGT